jgi:methylamine---glutamate N-methyltransferase subunit B
MTDFDLKTASVRDVNQALHDMDTAAGGEVTVLNPDGRHALACGVDAPIDVNIQGHAGYYCSGMNKQARVTIFGNAGVGVAENMMSGTVWVKGNASQSAGATAHGGMLVIEGDAAARCGVSLKGADVVVKGSIGHMSAFMAQAGRMVVCGDAGADLGDSLYEARIYVKGEVASLGSDCVAKEMRDEHLAELEQLLEAANADDDPKDFTRYGSARALYNFKVDQSSAY